MSHKYKGLFVSFEGIDYCGKTTQLKLLESHVQSLGANFVSHREPGGTLVGEQIRKVLFDKNNISMVDEAELLLFNASRAQYVQEVLIPVLERGDVFISDRFYDTTTAYQGYGRGLSLDAIALITGFVTRGVVPDLTYLLDVTVEESYKRKGKTLGDRIEDGGEEFYEKIRSGYLTIAREKPERIKLIDGMKSREECHAEIKKYFDEIFSSKFVVRKSVNQ